MSLYSEAEVTDLTTGYVVSNTVGSLYRWLEDHAAVKRIAEHSSEDTLLDELHQQVRVAPPIAESLALSYASLVAVALRRRAIGAPLGPSPIAQGALRWSTEFWNRALATSVPTSSLQIDALPRPTVKLARSENDAVSTLINLRGNPLRQE